MTSLPIVTFGKYKDKCISELLADDKYVSWLKMQDWFSKYKPIYNIIVNQQVISHDAKTPEHNKLQNMFLDEENRLKLLNNINGMFIKENTLLKKLCDTKTFYKCFGKINCEFKICESDEVEFEAKFNWDAVLSYQYQISLGFDSNEEYELKKKRKYKIKYELDHEYDENKFNIYYNKYIKEYYEKLFKDFYVEECRVNGDSSYYIHIFASKHYYKTQGWYDVCCELKPTLSDDYPCVLRKLKAQIILTDNIYDKEKAKFEEEGIHNIYAYTPNKKQYCLILNEFTSATTSIAQFIEIFNQTNIKVIFTKDLFKEVIEIISANPVMDLIEPIKFGEPLAIIDLIEENKILQYKLTKSDEQIIILEERIKYLEGKIK